MLCCVACCLCVKMNLCACITAWSEVYSHTYTVVVIHSRSPKLMQNIGESVLKCPNISCLILAAAVLMRYFVIPTIIMFFSVNDHALLTCCKFVLPWKTIGCIYLSTCLSVCPPGCLVTCISQEHLGGRLYVCSFVFLRVCLSVRSTWLLLYDIVYLCVWWLNSKNTSITKRYYVRFLFLLFIIFWIFCRGKKFLVG